MDFQRVVHARRMVRRYREQPVPRETVERIVATALRGPSAGFAQGVRMIVVIEAERRRRLAALCGEERYVAAGHEPWLSAAPAHVLLCVRADDYRERYAEPDKADATPADEWDVPFWWVDAGAALMLLLLAAVDEGLAAGVLQVVDVAGVRRFLGVPDDVAPVVLVTIGHPADDPGPLGSAARDRRPRDETLHWERW